MGRSLTFKLSLSLSEGLDDVFCSGEPELPTEEGAVSTNARRCDHVEISDMIAVVSDEVESVPLLISSAESDRIWRNWGYSLQVLRNVSLYLW